jgi:hypothetical protein
LTVAISAVGQWVRSLAITTIQKFHAVMSLMLTAAFVRAADDFEQKLAQDQSYYFERH